MHKIPILILALLLLASNLIISPIYAKNSISVGVSAVVLESITALTLDGKPIAQTNSNKETAIQELVLSGKNFRTYSLTY